MIPTAVVAAQYAGTLEFAETSRIDARANQPLPVAPTPPPREVALASDATYAPTARLRLSDRRWDYLLTYSPTFTVTDMELLSTSQPVVLNAGTASIAWHDRFVRVAVSESASYGWENLAYLYGTPVAGQAIAAGQAQSPGQTTGGTTTGGTTAGGTTTGGTTTTGQVLGQTGTAPLIPLQTFPFGSSSTTAGLQVHASRSVSFSLSGGYTLSGNLTGNPQASAIYPEQYGPSAAASLFYAASAAETLTTTVSAQETTTPAGLCPNGPAGTFCKQEAPILLAQETVRRRVSSTASLSASLGVSGSIYQLQTGEAWGILPVGGVTYTDRFGAPPKDARDALEASGVRLAADLVPTVNVFTGSPSNRVQLSATLVTHLTPRVVLDFVAGALQTVPLPQPDPSPLTLVNGGMDLRIRLTRLISVSAGLQGFWQSQQNLGAVPVAAGTTTSGTEVGYLALTVRAPRVKL